MDIRIDRPVLNGKTPEENLAKIDKWIADTSDKLNYLIEQLERNKDDNR